MINKGRLTALGKKIKSVRASKKLSQEEVAFRAEMSTRYLSDVECGKRNISAINIMKLAAALGVEVGELFPHAKNR